jgi:hypothetical protein
MTSLPKRAMSNLAAVMEMNSMKQQQRPKPNGQALLLRPQLISLSSGPIRMSKVEPTWWCSMPSPCAVVTSASGPAPGWITCSSDTSQVQRRAPRRQA